jgi:hypothetical protein
MAYIFGKQTDNTEYCDVLVENNPDADHWFAVAKAARVMPQRYYYSAICSGEFSRLHRIVSQERPMSADVSRISSVSWDGYYEWENYYRPLYKIFDIRSEAHAVDWFSVAIYHSRR